MKWTQILGMSWPEFLYSNCLSQRNKCYESEEKGHGQKGKSSIDLVGRQTICFLFIYSSSRSILIAKLPLTGRYFWHGEWELTLQVIPMIISSFSDFPRKVLRLKKKNRKATFNQHLSCVDLWRCSSGDLRSWIYCVFSLSGLEGQGRRIGGRTISLLIFNFESENALSWVHK